VEYTDESQKTFYVIVLAHFIPSLAHTLGDNEQVGLFFADFIK